MYKAFNCLISVLILILTPVFASSADLSFQGTVRVPLVYTVIEPTTTSNTCDPIDDLAAMELRLDQGDGWSIPVSLEASSPSGGESLTFNFWAEVPVNAATAIKLEIRAVDAAGGKSGGLIEDIVVDTTGLSYVSTTRTSDDPPDDPQ